MCNQSQTLLSLSSPDTSIFYVVGVLSKHVLLKIACSVSTSDRDASNIKQTIYFVIPCSGGTSQVPWFSHGDGGVSPHVSLFGNPPKIPSPSPKREQASGIVAYIKDGRKYRDQHHRGQFPWMVQRGATC